MIFKAKQAGFEVRPFWADGDYPLLHCVLLDRKDDHGQRKEDMDTEA